MRQLSSACSAGTEELTRTILTGARNPQVFGVARIFASFNDTFVHVTDMTGRETLVRVTGGMKVKADRDESSPYAAMLAAQDVAVRLKELGARLPLPESCSLLHDPSSITIPA